MDARPADNPVGRVILHVEIKPLDGDVPRRNRRKAAGEVGIVNPHLFVANGLAKGVIGLGDGIVIGALGMRGCGKQGERGDASGYKGMLSHNHWLPDFVYSRNRTSTNGMNVSTVRRTVN